MAKGKDFGSYKDEIKLYLVENYTVESNDAEEVIEEHLDIAREGFAAGGFAYAAGDLIAGEANLESQDSDDEEDNEDLEFEDDDDDEDDVDDDEDIEDT